MSKKSSYGAHYHCVYNLKYHLVLVTKYRRKAFTNQMLNDLEEKIRELADKWGVTILEFRGEADHVHLLLDMNPSIQPSKFINNLKTVSSRYMKKIHGEHLKRYYWGTNAMWSRAYCLITAGGAPLSVLKQYIETQERPH
ncbi:IS200/IS605 family transposase [Vibrio barjaei]|uniref:IS200/IS605 family transposase n=1 Tax=Vibrio barjaei TaxID=1676683 RepID=UPI002283C9D7|nr:IS200/IS605 family transposase [Vibrio barjaei]MCY9870379.1 IS200/IS605 family transposase [Vibrio barjaei]